MALLGAGLVLGAAGCSPIVRDATFRGARERVTDASLLGPFDGQIIDAATAEPIEGAAVVGVWSYDDGDGLLGPAGSEVAEVKTDRAGRYRLHAAPEKIRGRHTRLTSFTLAVYRRGYVGYRSELTFDGHPRTDFAARHNRIALRKWQSTDSHAQHLVYLLSPPALQVLSRWENDQANLELYRRHRGEARSVVQQDTTLELLDASALLRPEDVRRRTGFTGAFQVKELGDLVRTHFYHGVHLEALDRDEAWDIGLRVWQDPPGGLTIVEETIAATLPGVERSSEITDDTWIYDSADVRAVAFLDRDRKVGVLLTCGGQQCVDVETAIILGGFVHHRLGEIRHVPVAEAPESPKKESPP